MKWNKGLVGLLILATMGLSACHQRAEAARNRDTPVIKVGILQLIDQSALTQAREGFLAELAKAGYTGDRIQIDYVNAQGDQANLKLMSDRLKADGNTVNLALATPAAQALARTDPNTPMIFTAVSDPISAGLVDPHNRLTQNITGVTDNVDSKAQIAYLHHLFPKATTVGMLYNAAEQNSVVQVNAAKKAAQALGLTVVAQTVASTNDVQQAMESLAAKSDVVYTPTDNTVAAAMAVVAKVSLKTHVPVMPAASTMVKDGGVANLGIDYVALGHQAGKLAVRIIQGEPVRDLPVEAPAQVSVIKNRAMMAAFDITDQMTAPN